MHHVPGVGSGKAVQKGIGKAPGEGLLFFRGLKVGRAVLQTFQQVEVCLPGGGVQGEAFAPVKGPSGHHHGFAPEHHLQPYGGGVHQPGPGQGDQVEGVDVRVGIHHHDVVGAGREGFLYYLAHGKAFGAQVPFAGVDPDHQLGLGMAGEIVHRAGYPIRQPLGKDLSAQHHRIAEHIGREEEDGALQIQAQALRGLAAPLGRDVLPATHGTFPRASLPAVLHGLADAGFFLGRQGLLAYPGPHFVHIQPHDRLVLAEPHVVPLFVEFKGSHGKTQVLRHPVGHAEFQNQPVG